MSLVEWTIGNDEIHPIWHVWNAFNDEQIEWIENLATQFEEKDAILVPQKDGSSSFKPEIRQSKIKWISAENEETHDLYRMLVDYVIDANSKNFYLPLYGIERLQYTTYNCNDEVSHFYGKHSDSGWGKMSDPQRKRRLSFSLALSDPSEYEGGELIIYVDGKENVVPKDKGTITFFHSHLTHEVKPVTKGERRSLVGWCKET